MVTWHSYYWYTSSSCGLWWPWRLKHIILLWFFFALWFCFDFGAYQSQWPVIYILRICNTFDFCCFIAIGFYNSMQASTTLFIWCCIPCCWLGCRKASSLQKLWWSIGVVIWSKAMCKWIAYCPADTTAIPSTSASENPVCFTFQVPAFQVVVKWM